MKSVAIAVVMLMEMMMDGPLSSAAISGGSVVVSGTAMVAIETLACSSSSR